MDILVLLSAVSLCLAGAAGAIKQMHMMQQNSYYLSRYFKWLASQSDFGFYARTALGVIIALLFMVKWYAFAFIISLLFAAFCLCKNIKEQKKAIKPLVFTQRIIRTFSVAVALLFIGVLLFALVQNGIIKIVALTLCSSVRTARSPGRRTCSERRFSRISMCSDENSVMMLTSIRKAI